MVQVFAVNLSTIKNDGVHSYCLGILHNTAPHAHALHRDCCNRLLALIGGLRKRLLQCRDEAQRVATEMAEWVSFMCIARVLFPVSCACKRGTRS